MILEVSNTSMSVARGCWKKYYWNYIEGLRPKKKASQLRLGEVVHKGFEKFYTGTSDQDVLSFIRSTYDEEIAKSFIDDQEHVRVAQATAMGMWAGYPYKNPKEFEEHKVELEFRLKLPGIRGTRLVGRADGIVKMGGVWWVREIKTTGLNLRQFEGRMKNSSQVTGYCIAAKQLDYPVQGVLYDAIKKPYLRKRSEERVDQFCDRIIAWYVSDGNKSEGNRDYYARLKTYRNEGDINRYLDDTKKLVYEIRRHRNRNQWERNTDQCWNFNSECPYAKICFQDKPDSITVEAYYETRKGRYVQPPADVIT